jgi:hypothetical protein
MLRQVFYTDQRDQVETSVWSLRIEPWPSRLAANTLINYVTLQHLKIVQYIAFSRDVIAAMLVSHEQKISH